MKFLKALIARLLRLFAKKVAVVPTPVVAPAAVVPATGAPQPKA